MTKKSEPFPPCLSSAAPHQPFSSSGRDRVGPLHCSPRCLKPSNTPCPQPVSMACCLQPGLCVVQPLAPVRSQLCSFPFSLLLQIAQPSISAALASCLRLTGARCIPFWTSVIRCPWLEPSPRLVPSQYSGVYSHTSSGAFPGPPPPPQALSVQQLVFKFFKLR